MLYAFALLAMAASSLAENLPPTAEGAVALAAQAVNVLVPPPLCVDTANGAKGYYTDNWSIQLKVDCAWIGFRGLPNNCGKTDDDDFTASVMCCNCGGGLSTTPLPPSPPSAVPKCKDKKKTKKCLKSKKKGKCDCSTKKCEKTRKKCKATCNVC